ncbi:MAG: hypothetical protein AABN33_05755 [Acidobacteriota bacterium]
MTDEEMHRAMEFIIQQQAQYAARIEKDEPRLAKVEESFTMLVELARRRDVRPNTIGHRFDNDESRVARLEESFTMLVELARRMDERRDINGANDGDAEPHHQ